MENHTLTPGQIVLAKIEHNVIPGYVIDTKDDTVLLAPVYGFEEEINDGKTFKLSEMDDYYNSKDDSTLPISVNKRNVFKTNKDL